MLERKDDRCFSEYENCVLCGKRTEILRKTPTHSRENYIEGCGQLCPECAKETVDIFRAFLNTLSEPQRAYLNKFYDGEEIA